MLDSQTTLQNPKTLKKSKPNVKKSKLDDKTSELATETLQFQTEHPNVSRGKRFPDFPGKSNKFRGKTGKFPRKRKGPDLKITVPN